MLSMVKDHRLQFKCWPSWFSSYKQYNTEGYIAHYPVIQKKVSELLAKGNTELSTVGISFYSKVFVMSKYTGGLPPALKQFHYYVHIPTLKNNAIKQEQQLIQHGPY